MLSNIKAEMYRNEMTNAKMAKKLGISENSFSFKLNEKREFTLTELAAMAVMFQCSIDYLIEKRNPLRGNLLSEPESIAQ